MIAPVTAVLAAVLAVAAPAAPATRAAGPLVDKVFARRFAFCADPRYALTKGEVEWCSLLPPDVDRRCPHLREACRQGATAVIDTGHEASTLLKVPGLSGIARWVFWGLLGAGVIILLVRVFRQRIGFDLRRVASEGRGSRAVVDTESVQARAVETDVERLLQQARQAAAAGDFRGAIEDAYAAMLRKLEGGGLLRVEPHCTNGDHVRDVGHKAPALRPAVEAVVSRVESVQFGGAPADEGSFRAVLADVLGLIGQRLALLAPLVAGLALAGIVGGCMIDRGQRDESPSGRAAVVAFLQQYGLQPRDRLLPLAKVDGSVEQLVLLPGVSVDAEGWSALRGWAAGGGTLLLAGATRDLPGWITASFAPGPGRSSDPVTVASDQADRFTRLTAKVPASAELLLRPPPTGESDSGGDAAVLSAQPLLMRGAAPYAVEQAIGQGRVVVLANDGLFTNASLLVADNAQLLGELLMEGGKRVELTGDLTGLVSPTPLSSVERGQLAPALIQLAIVALLFFACQGAHFGRPLDPRAAQRRAFSEHVRALGLQYARARASRHALEVYRTYALERLRERLHLSARKGSDVAEAVAARTGRPVAEVLPILADARADSPGQVDVAFAPEDLATLREIATLLNATGGAGERS